MLSSPFISPLVSSLIKTFKWIKTYWLFYCWHQLLQAPSIALYWCHSQHCDSSMCFSFQIAVVSHVQASRYLLRPLVKYSHYLRLDRSSMKYDQPLLRLKSTASCNIILCFKWKLASIARNSAYIHLESISACSLRFKYSAYSLSFSASFQLSRRFLPGWEYAGQMMAHSPFFIAATPFRSWPCPDHLSFFRWHHSHATCINCS